MKFLSLALTAFVLSTTGCAVHPDAETGQAESALSNARHDYVVFDGDGYRGNFYSSVPTIVRVKKRATGDCRDFYTQSFGSPCDYPDVGGLEWPLAQVGEPFGIVYYQYPGGSDPEITEA